MLEKMPTVAKMQILNTFRQMGTIVMQSKKDYV